jgi:catechol 2,3-dioxygenase-like lactoylglutathione lyase family enzyme
MFEIRAVAHFSIPVSDLVKSTQFYTDVVGCRQLSTTPNGQMVFLDASEKPSGCTVIGPQRGRRQRRCGSLSRHLGAKLAQPASEERHYPATVATPGLGTANRTIGSVPNVTLTSDNKRPSRTPGWAGPVRRNSLLRLPSGETMMAAAHKSPEIRHRSAGCYGSQRRTRSPIAASRSDR